MQQALARVATIWLLLSLDQLSLTLYGRRRDVVGRVSQGDVDVSRVRTSSGKYKLRE